MYIDVFILGSYLSETIMNEHYTTNKRDWDEVSLFPKLRVDFVDILSITNNHRQVLSIYFIKQLDKYHNIFTRTHKITILYFLSKIQFNPIKRCRGGGVQIYLFLSTFIDKFFVKNSIGLKLLNFSRYKFIRLL